MFQYRLRLLVTNYVWNPDEQTTECYIGGDKKRETGNSYKCVTFGIDVMTVIVVSQISIEISWNSGYNKVWSIH